jgi:hypothetical protein
MHRDEQRRFLSSDETLVLIAKFTELKPPFSTRVAIPGSAEFRVMAKNSTSRGISAVIPRVSRGFSVPWS